MHSGFEIPGIQQENTCAAGPVLIPTSPAHFLDQIHTQQLFHIDPHHFHHHYAAAAAAAASPPYFPVNFKLGLNSTNHDYNINNINKDGGGLVRGSERYQTQMPEARQSSLGMIHSWQNQQDSTNKQTLPFWEPLPEEASNENSEIIDKQENLTACLATQKTRLHFGELEAIYNRLGTPTDQSTTPVTEPHVPVGLDHGSEPSIGAEEGSDTRKKTRRRKKKKKKKKKRRDEMTEFFGKLVKRVMDHQENLQRKFMEVVERLDDERREREEEWRKQELECFERGNEVRVKEKALAISREDVIVSYLEKFTGHRIGFP